MNEALRTVSVRSVDSMARVWEFPMHRCSVVPQCCGSSLPQLRQVFSSSRWRPPLLPERVKTAMSTSCASRISASQQKRRFSLRSQADTGQLKGTDVEAGLEEMDEEELDELFEELGEVVVADSEQRTPTSEVDGDSESLAFAMAMAEAANEVKAADIKVLFVKPLIYWTRFFVLTTGFSKPQIGAIADRMREVALGFNREPRGDQKPNAWTLLDFGDVVVHVFQPKERAYYNLEEFYGNAPVVELPFESRTLQ